MSLLPYIVMYLCTNNRLRSVIAQRLTHKHYPTHIQAISAGVRHNIEPPLDFAVAVMKEVDIDISTHVPTHIKAVKADVNLVISLSPEARHGALLYADEHNCETFHWPCPDPSLLQGNREQILWGYRELRNQLETKIVKYFSEYLS